MNLIKQYKPIIPIHESFNKCITLNDELFKIYNFIEIDETSIIDEKQQNKLNRYFYIHALDDIAIDKKSLKYIFEDSLEKENFSDISLKQYHKAELYLLNNIHQPLSIELLNGFYKIILTDVYNISQPDYLKKLTAKQNIDNINELNLLFDFINNDSEFHPLLQGWMLLFKATEYPVFFESRFRIASLLFNFWITKNNLNPCGLLNVEQELYVNKLKLLQLIDINKKVQLNEKLEFGLNLHTTQLFKIKDIIKNHFRKQIGFDNLNPRQKNIINFIFERGYMLQQIDEQTLNSRQKNILKILKRKGFISTKDLTSLFDCNRKTIQRDFNLLIDLGLVKAIGAGAGLRYCVNLIEKKSNPFANFHSNLIFGVV